MLRSVIETSREIPISVKRMHDSNTTNDTSFDKVSLAYEEVGVAHSSDEAPVMGSRAKEPYLVDVNSEEGLHSQEARPQRDMRWQVN